MLPGLVAFLSALAGLLDRDLTTDEETHVQAEFHEPQPQGVDPMPMLHEALFAMQRQVNIALGELADVVEREVDRRMQEVRPVQPTAEPVKVEDLLPFSELDEPIEFAAGRAARIRQLRETRKTWKEIAAYYRVSEKTVQNWAKEG
ncbi:MAG TPA: hypothetical protein VH186_33875 [Chloroflexia bacterium]|nr:hypothetical protein [Chloroflexia bacterium]